MNQICANRNTLIDIICARAEQQPDFPVYTFESASGNTRVLTFSQLVSTASSVAAMLRERDVRSPVVVLHPTNSPEVICSFFGCLFHGNPAIPTIQPRRPKDIERLCGVLRDSGSTTVLTSKAFSENFSAPIEQMLSARLQWIDSENVNPSAHWKTPKASGSSVAHLQYTSGSVAEPKGVAITHSNILHNLNQIDEDFSHTNESISVSWLPHFHDMGLVYGILAAAVIGFRAVLLKPSDFVQEPSLWLKTITKYSATHSGGPNFAFEMCANRLKDADKSKLDLRSWRVAFIGAEVIRPQTLRKFVRTVSTAGFEARALYPAYGLAEATLKVTGRVSANVEDAVKWFSKSALMRGVAWPATPSDGDALEIVSCGKPCAGVRIEIVDPERAIRVDSNQVGEVWVAGPNKAKGYWLNEEQSEETFRAHLPGEDSEFLRTGDLGFLYAEELYITGRRKEIVILRGLNLSPDELESSAALSHPAFHGRAGVAFSIDRDGEERLIVVQEVDRHSKAEQNEELFESIAKQLVKDFGILVWEVILVRSGIIPRTTSGKLQRNACKALYLESRLPSLATRRYTPGERLDGDAFAKSPDSPEKEAIDSPKPEAIILRLVEEATRIKDGAYISSTDSLPALGFDSVECGQLLVAIRSAYGVSLTFDDLFLAASLEEIGRRVFRRTSQLPPVIHRGGVQQMHREDSRTATSEELRLWAIHDLFPNCAAHRIVFGIRLQGNVNVPVLEMALNAVLRSHPSLRSAYSLHSRELTKSPMSNVTAKLPACRAPMSFLEQKLVLTEIAQEMCRRPISLEKGDLGSFKLLQFSDQEYVLIAALHHIALDAASAELVFEDLAERYAQLAEGQLENEGMAELRHASGNGTSVESYSPETDIEFWKRNLTGAPERLEFPFEGDSRNVIGQAAMQLEFMFESSTLDAIRGSSKRHKTTPFTILTGAFVEALGQWSGLSEMVVATPVNGRVSEKAWSEVGIFAYPLLLRFAKLDNSDYEAYLRQIHAVVRDALAHQRLPFQDVIKSAQPRRRLHQFPFMDVMFNYFRRRTPTTLTKGGLQFTLIPLDNGAAESVISLTLVETREGQLNGALKFPLKAFNLAPMSALQHLYRECIRRSV
jgi:acyl-CoA synthetase (AMP-forming)/AMP-acid ligase II